MTPEQIHQLASGDTSVWFWLLPFWMKAAIVLQILSTLVTVICLPLITLKLYFGNRPAGPTSLSEEQIRLLQVRERREALERTMVPTIPAQKNPNEESRYMPKE